MMTLIPEFCGYKPQLDATSTIQLPFTDFGQILRKVGSIELQQSFVDITIKRPLPALLQG
jgi:hypothetical protein